MLQEEYTFKKMEMAQIFDGAGLVLPITLLVSKEPIEGKFEIGDKLIIVGKSKGKGFAGVVKRWGFHGGPKTHGQSDRHRAPGAIGAGTDPGRVWKGQRMAGRMGQKKVTVKNLKIVDIDNDKKIIKVAGSVPGSRQSKVLIRKV